MWTDERADVGRIREEKRREEARRSEKESEEQKCRCVKGRTVAKHYVFFRCFVAPEGRKVGSLKRWVRSHLGRWEMKNCTPPRHEACFQVKTVKGSRVRKTFGFGALWELEMSKKSTLLWREAHSKSKCKRKHTMQSTFGNRDVEKVHATVARNVKLIKTTHARTLFWTLKRRFCAAKNEGSISRTLSSVGEGLHFGASDLQVCQDDFAEHVQHFVWPGLTFSWQGHSFRHMEWQNRQKNALIRGRQLCTQLSIFEGSLAELSRFGCCQLRKMGKSCRIASFSSLQIDRWKDRQRDR